MGLTGAGKSTFIERLTQQDVEIGHTLESCTTDAMAYFFHRKNGQKIYLIDTPGFDDTHADNAKVFREIAALLCTVHTISIGGMIYVHRITDMRMSGSARNSLRIFEKICGDHCFEDVTIVTTMWGLLKTKEARDAAIAREDMLKDRSEFFGRLMKGNARMTRHEDTYESALQVVELLAARQKKVTLQLQREMRVSERITLGETTAGRYLEGELATTRQKYEVERKELEEWEIEVRDDEDLRSTVSEQLKDYTERVNKIRIDEGSLSITCEDMRQGFGEIEVDEKSERLDKLEERLQTLQRQNQAQSEKLEDRDKKNEALIKALEDQIKREPIARGKAKKRTQFQRDWFRLVYGPWFRFPAKETKELEISPHREESHPVLPSRRSGSKLTKKSNRSKGRHKPKPGAEGTPPFDDSTDDQSPPRPYQKDQHTTHAMPHPSERNTENGAGDPVPLKNVSLAMAPASHSNLSAYPHGSYSKSSHLYVPSTVTIDPSGMIRSPPAPPNRLRRTFLNPFNSHSRQYGSRSESGIEPEDIIIAVMGITGCGKTTFVNYFSETPLAVGHGLDSCTNSVQVVPCTLNDGVKIYLVDTPGFDDSTRTDSEILQEVVLWLNKAHVSNLKLAGIIFLHRICDVRIGGSGIRNIKMFQKLCGDTSLASVVLATTMWDITSRDAALTREKELKKEPHLWKRMIGHGSQVFRHDKDKGSALEIIRYLIARKKPVTLDIQREMVDEKLELLQTGAGNELASVVEQLIEQYESRLKEVERELKEARAARDQSNQLEREMLEEAKNDYQVRLRKQQQEMANLRINAEELVQQMDKRLEASEERQKESLRQLQECHVQELKKQKALESKKIRDQYLREMSGRACAVM
ncbi:hypothetical protein BDW02DRAFT_591715 [Decorospora gaudefroyi]|uniref:G domain-containing protein n=1 Tax=Decorospora gaudefroyi TaxID=184978 RepID=A0A6A5JZM2_9PLEO|nr:hypothetical protein BDW02DRAFT_591715 [Decorospora gaudefroyi]